jgi:AAA+ superfamily predicted ATPase
MEEGNSTDSLIICSTNHPSLLDRALLRRYDQVLEFDAPTGDQIRRLVSASISPLKTVRMDWKRVLEVAQNLSQAEIVRASDDAVKTAILDERKSLTTEQLVTRLEERHAMRAAFLDVEGA